jgi:hypothetical protein
MCAIDLLGVPAMLGQELRLESRCAFCDLPVVLRVRPGVVVAATPTTARVVARPDERAPAHVTCCPFTHFACDRPHAEHLARQRDGARVLSLATALVHAEVIFAGLLGPTLPAARPRGRRWE